MSFKYKSLFIAGISALVLSACGNISKVSSEGTTDETVWPKVERVGMNNKMGIFPDLNRLNEVKPGMTKDQLYYLLGRPHFGEGFIAVREWDYLFHFHTPTQGTNGVTTCQFKVLFDSNRLTRDFHWKAVDPVDGSCPPGAKPEVLTLDADALFAFDSSNLQAEGQRKLQEFAAGLSKIGDYDSVEVAGYTDRLGPEAYNLSLSQDRANSVKNYLVDLGIPGNKVSAQGYGESNPVVQCDGSGNELIACLQPNRRVEIELKR
ncbi:OmpA family protein [Oligella ureolytica]